MKKFPTPRENHARIVSGVSRGYPAAGLGPSEPNRNTNTNTPVRHLPAVQFGDVHQVTDSIVRSASAKAPKPASVRVPRREPGNTQPLPPVRGTAAAKPVGADVKNPKSPRR